MSGDADAEDRVNMVPLIDTMFFIIVFFMLVMKFTPEEKAITNLLPTEGGQQGNAVSKVEKKPQVNLLVFPAGMQKGGQPSEYQRQFQGMLDDGSFGKEVTIRIGGAQMTFAGATLSAKGADNSLIKGDLDTVAGFVANGLKPFDVGGTRKEQPPVVISCFSALPWKYAVVVYDAVREYEAQLAGKRNKTNEDLLDAREIGFAPPRIRNYHTNELGNELFEIIHFK